MFKLPVRFVTKHGAKPLTIMSKRRTIYESNLAKAFSVRIGEPVCLCHLEFFMHQLIHHVKTSCEAVYNTRSEPLNNSGKFWSLIFIDVKQTVYRDKEYSI